MSRYFTIGQAASYLNISIETIRFYENEGLIPIIDRDTNNYRMISLSHLLHLKGVTQLRQAGFTLEQIKDLNRASTIETPDLQFQLILEGLNQVKKKIQTLEQVQKGLTENLSQLKDYYALKHKGCLICDWHDGSIGYDSPRICNISDMSTSSDLVGLHELLSDEDLVIRLSKESAKGSLFLLKAFSYKEEWEIDAVIDQLKSYCHQNSLRANPAIYLKVLARPSYYMGDRLAAVVYLNLEGSNEYTGGF